MSTTQPQTGGSTMPITPAPQITAEGRRLTGQTLIPGHDYRGHGAHCKGRCGYIPTDAERCDCSSPDDWHTCSADVDHI